MNLFLKSCCAAFVAVNIFALPAFAQNDAEGSDPPESAVEAECEEPGAPPVPDREFNSKCTALLRTFISSLQSGDYEKSWDCIDSGTQHDIIDWFFLKENQDLIPKRVSDLGYDACYDYVLDDFRSNGELARKYWDFYKNDARIDEFTDPEDCQLIVEYDSNFGGFFVAKPDHGELDRWMILVDEDGNVAITLPRG